MSLGSVPFLGVFLASFGCTTRFCSSGKRIEIEFCPGCIQGCNLNEITANLKSTGDHFT